jgi:hypothetical protein
MLAKGNRTTSGNKTISLPIILKTHVSQWNEKWNWIQACDKILVKIKDDMASISNLCPMRSANRKLGKHIFGLSIRKKHYHTHFRLRTNATFSLQMYTMKMLNSSFGTVALWEKWSLNVSKLMRPSHFRKDRIKTKLRLLSCRIRRPLEFGKCVPTFRGRAASTFRV